MITDRSRSVYASAPFKFIVDGEPLYIHADLVSLHSKPLDRMINGHMAEAQKGYATLEDVDQGTFVRFIEWAHRGYYTAAEFQTVEIKSPCTPTSQNHDDAAASQEKRFDEAAPLPQEEMDLEPPAATDASSYRKGKRGKKAIHKGWGIQFMDNEGAMSDQELKKETAEEMKRELKEAYISREYTVRRTVFDIPSPRPNQYPEEDYTDVFLSHAQLYVFADAYLIQPLKMLALEELHATLAIYTLYPVRTGDIIALLRYVYGNTKQSNGGEEDLRKELTAYIGTELDTLMKDDDLRDLMIEDGGSLLGDFMTMVGRRSF